MQQDVFRAMRSLARQGFKANIVFFDPPYDWKPYRDLLEIIFKHELLSQPARVVIEHHRKASFPNRETDIADRASSGKATTGSASTKNTGVRSQNSEFRMARA